MISKYSTVIPVIAFLLLFVSSSNCGPRKPGVKDKCPVCGMFVAEYPEFLAQIIRTDGSVLFFDGPKDFFSFIENSDRYSSKIETFSLNEFYVTDYYSQEPINAGGAWYVVDSDILGPMGKELVPFKTKDDAIEFISDHSGTKILRFNEINKEILIRLHK